MRDRRPLLVFAVVALLAVLFAGAFALGAFKSDAERAQEAVEALMEGYIVPVEEDELAEGEEAPESSWPADDYGDASTADALSRYGVDVDAWRTHCLEHLAYEVGEASVDGESATVSVTMTNASLSSAVEAGASDFVAFSQTQEYEDTYASGGKSALFTKLVDFVYAHLDANEAPVTTTVSVRCEKGDGGWGAAVTGDTAFFSALYGSSNVIDGLAVAEDASEGE